MDHLLFLLVTSALAGSRFVFSTISLVDDDQALWDDVAERDQDSVDLDKLDSEDWRLYSTEGIEDEEQSSEKSEQAGLNQEWEYVERAIASERQDEGTPEGDHFDVDLRDMGEEAKKEPIAGLSSRRSGQESWTETRTLSSYPGPEFNPLDHFRELVIGKPLYFPPIENGDDHPTPRPLSIGRNRR